MNILNYKSFLLDTDNFSVTISKSLYHTSFKLNIVNFSRALPPGPLLNPLWDSSDPGLPTTFYFSIHARNIFNANDKYFTSKNVFTNATSKLINWPVMEYKS